MYTLHVLYELVRNLEHLLTVLARQELTRGLMLTVVYEQIEWLGERNLTLFTLQVSFVLKVIVTDMILHYGEVMCAVVALSAVVPVAHIVVLYVTADLCFARVKGPLILIHGEVGW